MALIGNLKGSGSAGPAGPAGPAGATGPAGVAGTKWHWGTDVPADTLGVDGDFYLRMPQGDVYNKAGGHWA